MSGLLIGVKLERGKATTNHREGQDIVDWKFSYENNGERVYNSFSFWDFQKKSWANFAKSSKEHSQGVCNAPL